MSIKINFGFSKIGLHKISSSTGLIFKQIRPRVKVRYLEGCKFKNVIKALERRCLSKYLKRWHMKHYRDCDVRKVVLFNLITVLILQIVSFENFSDKLNKCTQLRIHFIAESVLSLV